MLEREILELSWRKFLTLLHIHNLNEQFTAYRSEKGENERMMTQQMETLRQEISALKMGNVKMAANRNYSIIINVACLLQPGDAQLSLLAALHHAHTFL